VSYCFRNIASVAYLVPGGAIFDASTSVQILESSQFAADIGYDTRANQPWRSLSIRTDRSLLIDTAFANDYLYLAGANLTNTSLLVI